MNRCMVALREETRKLQFGFVVGGDLNTELNIGFRGSLFSDLVDTFELQIANDEDNHDPDADMWTFESSMGVRRRIYFLFFSFSLPLLSASATDYINMGSDHRAVTACFDILLAKKVGKNRRFRMNKGRKPKPSTNEVAETYENCIHVSLRGNSPQTVSDLERCVLEV